MFLSDALIKGRHPHELPARRQTDNSRMPSRERAVGEDQAAGEWGSEHQVGHHHATQDARAGTARHGHAAAGLAALGASGPGDVVVRAAVRASGDDAHARHAEDPAAAAALHVDGRLRLHGLRVDRRRLRHALLEAHALLVGSRSCHWLRSSRPSLRCSRPSLGPNRPRRYTRTSFAHADHLLLQGRQRRHDAPRRAGVAAPLDVLDLDVLLRVHAAVHRHDQAIRKHVEFVRDIAETPDDLYEVDEEAGEHQNVVVARRVLPIEACLHHEPVAAQGQPRAAAGLDDEAAAVLRIAQGPTRAHASAAHVRLPGQVEKLHPLLVGCAARTAAAVEEGQRCCTRCLEQPDLPLPRAHLPHLLFNRHCKRRRDFHTRPEPLSPQAKGEEKHRGAASNLGPLRRA
mmetsp:Transcript_10681/g.33189  ORF Transcript_10681/g.33189 Transcript_10681/m.33189 type:complete len:401 (+) Transcript_10681:158-1360(+)